MNPHEIPAVSANDPVLDQVRLLDVRENDEWSAGHAPGALHIPMGELPSRVHELTDLDNGQNSDQPVYVICRTGGRSSRVTAWLNTSGWDAINISGGMQGWLAAGKPVVSEIPDAEPEIL